LEVRGWDLTYPGAIRNTRNQISMVHRQTKCIHGCIRMYNKNAKELYDIVPYGTIVTIVHKNRPFKELKSW